jgi:hypothetical protein
MNWMLYGRAFLIVAAVAALGGPAAEGQVLLGRGRGLIINVPGAAVRVGPFGIYGGPPRLLTISPYGIAPTYGVPGYGDPLYGSRLPLRRYAARPTSPAASTDSQELPTDGELRAMTDSDLLNATVNLAARLNADLERFTSAASWQNHLRLPEDALPPPTRDGRVVLGVNSLTESLSRFESAVANPEYVQITGLPSYAAMHAALKEIVRRYGGAGGSPSAIVQQSPGAAQSVDRSRPGSQSIEMQNLHKAPLAAASTREVSTVAEPAVGEELPMPPPALVPPQNEPAIVAPRNQTDDGEHSILSR